MNFKIGRNKLNLKLLFSLLFLSGIFQFASASENNFNEEQNCFQGECVVFKVSINLKDAGRSSTTTNDVIYIGGNANPYTSTIDRNNDTCSKTVKVPVPVYRTIAKIMDSISGSEDGEPAPALTPAQQTILLFYSTLMQQTLSFTCKSTT